MLWERALGRHEPTWSTEGTLPTMGPQAGRQRAKFASKTQWRQLQLTFQMTQRTRQNHRAARHQQKGLRSRRKPPSRLEAVDLSELLGEFSPVGGAAAPPRLNRA